MATSVRVEEAVKATLDRFQGHIQSETGERLSHSALLARLLRFAERREAEFLGGGDEPRLPTPEDMETHLAKAKRYGIDIDVTRIDEELYGG